MTRKYQSVAEWAKALGSKAQTKKGQRKVIIDSFSHQPGWLGHGRRTTLHFVNYSALGRDSNAKTAWLKDQAAAKLYRSPEQVEARRLAAIKAARDVLQYEVDGGGNKTAIWNVSPVSRNYAIVAGWTVRVLEQAEYDWQYYSKSYGHPKKTVTARIVMIRRIDQDGQIEKRDQEVDAFRGNYVLDALVKAGVLPLQAGLMNVRLHAAYNARPIREGRSVKIYERSLAGDVIDFCAVVRGVTFHAPTVKAAVAGLKIKVRRSVLRKKGGLIDWKLCKSLGFCDTGLNAFCRTFGFDTKSGYTPNEIAARVKANLSAAAPFASELNTLAKAVNYTISL